MIDRNRFLEILAADALLWPNFLTLCDFGGRLAGSCSERASRDWAAGELSSVPGGSLRRDPVRYAGWTCHGATLTELSSGRELAVTPLLATASTPPGGRMLEVVNCGRGAPDRIALAGEAVRGRAVLVEHEYPFASWTIHRRVKLGAAIQAGAAAFLIAQPEPGIGPVSGSAGLAPGRMIPGLGLSAEAAAQIAGPGRRVRLTVDGSEEPEARTETLVLDLPGRGPERVVLSAHIDGHSLAESALDNATGVAAALALARATAAFLGKMERGLTVCLFSAEEWALTGSREWLDKLPVEERSRIVLNVNLDAIAGASTLTALTSDFSELGDFVHHAATAARLPLAVHKPLMANSDHANFASRGIPALRLLAGFGQPRSNLRYILTGADTRALTDPQELKTATLTAGAILWQALQADPDTVAALRRTNTAQRPKTGEA
jgi:aminopeptidase YwaD